MKKEINLIGKKVIDLQIKALKKLKGSINESFVDAVKKIVKCKSKVIICGVGKSGIIASKFLPLWHLLEHHLFQFQLMIVHTEIWDEFQKKMC